MMQLLQYYIICTAQLEPRDDGTLFAKPRFYLHVAAPVPRAGNEARVLFQLTLPMAVLCV